MALKKGLCHNYGECDLADSKELQEKDSTEFVCEECGKPLYPVDSEKKAAKGGNKRPIIFICTAVLLIGIIIACILLFGKSEPITLTLNKSESELIIGNTDTLTPNLMPEDFDCTIVWSSDNENVVMVSSTGIVKALSEGEANVIALIQAKKEEIKAICHYTILPIPVSDSVELIDFAKLSFVREKIEMNEGDSIKISPIVEPANGNETVRWLSSDEKIATVDSTGLVVARTAGNAIISVQSSRTLLTANMPVQVKKTVKAKASTGQSNKKSLGYATFEGPLQNGQPHGNGVMYFSQKHIIPGTVNVTAEAGEKVIGSFREGKINVGTLYRKNGNQVVVRSGQEF